MKLFHLLMNFMEVKPKRGYENPSENDSNLIETFGGNQILNKLQTNWSSSNWIARTTFRIEIVEIPQLLIKKTQSVMTYLKNLQSYFTKADSDFDLQNAETIQS